jgi:hypothetical protein
MKNTLLSLLALVFITSCSDKKSEKNLQVTGNIKGLQKGTLYLKKMKDTTLVLLDSIAINGDSHFESNLKLDSPEMLYLFLNRGETKSIDNSIMFFAEPGKINIDTDLALFYAKAKITGSKNHTLYEEYKKVSSKLNVRQLELMVERMNANRNNNVKLSANKETEYNAVLKRKYLYAINFAVNNANYEVSPYIALSEIGDATVTYLDTINKSMSPKVAKSKYGVMLTKYVAERKKTE